LLFGERSVFLIAWIKDSLFRLSRQLTEPFVYFYEHWIRRDPDGCVPAGYRNRRVRLLRSLPAVLIAIAILGLATLCAASSTTIQKRYRDRLEDSADKAHESQLLRIGQRILTEPAIFGSEDRFELATRLVEVNPVLNASISDRIVESLAPEDTQGFPPAHRARALADAQILNEQPIDSQRLKALGWHLQQTSGLEDIPLLRVRSQYYIATGQFELASSELSKLAQSAPEYWFALAEVLLRRGDLNSARSALSRAAQVYEKLVGQNPADAEVRIRYATALGRLGEFDSAIESMKAGWKLTNDIRFSEGICDVYLMKYQKHRNLQSSVDQQWMNLQQAIEWNPKNRLAYEALSQLCADQNAQSIGDQLRDKIESLLDQSYYTPELLFAKTNLVLAQGDRKLAIGLLSDLVVKYPDFHPALNNLAWLRTDQGDVSIEELQKAEKDARRAVELVPRSGSYRDTLGVILTKQNRWTEAIAEFERSLGNSQGPIPTLEKIAEAYHQIGQEELSKQYRARIEQLKPSTQSLRN
jgi:tetratricopeptide (TPR) repeat protein